MFPPYPTSFETASRMGGAARPGRVGPVEAPADVRSADPRPSWRSKVRHAVDLAVAFATLADPEPAQAGSAPAPVDRHPHRTPLRPAPRPRRPGAALARPQPCLSPVGRRPATPPARRTRLS